MDCRCGYAVLGERFPVELHTGDRRGGSPYGSDPFVVVAAVDLVSLTDFRSYIVQTDASYWSSAGVPDWSIETIEGGVVVSDWLLETIT